MALKTKLETGVQLLSRLTKKASFENFYTPIFKRGLKHGEIVEIFSNNNPNFLLYELISETLIPQEFGGIESGVVIFITDGNFNITTFVKILKDKLKKHLVNKKEKQVFNDIDALLEFTLNNIQFIYLYDATEFYITVSNLGSILVKHPNISLIVFNTLHAFYWSEQGFKATKMDVYTKNLIKIIQKACKDFKTVVFYTRLEYFSSTKDTIDKLEPCCSTPTDERINYRIQVSTRDEGCNFIIVQSYDNLFTKEFKLSDGKLIWELTNIKTTLCN